MADVQGRTVRALSSAVVAALAVLTSGAAFGADDPKPNDTTPDASMPQGLLREPRPKVPEPPPETKPERQFIPPPRYAPPGYSGPSSVLPSVEPPPDWSVLPPEDRNRLGLPPHLDPRFLPIEDRWRLGLPPSDRYGHGNREEKVRRKGEDYPQIEGHIWDPYNLNVLKGDYPIVGNHTFLNLTGTSLTVIEGRNLPTPTTPFESTRKPGQVELFGNGTQFFFNQDFRLNIQLFHGQAAFKPFDWQIQLMPVFNVNVLDVRELAITSNNVLQDNVRRRSFMALEEWFFETKLADLSDQYDFVSLRVGSQFFLSDFRGFIFSDTNRGIRLFGNGGGNRDQFNLAFFSMQEKDTNSGLNTFNDRHQYVLIGNYFRQDFLFPGYTVEASIHYNHDDPSFKYDRNHRLVRPDGTGVFTPHQIDAVYLGMASDGHIGRINVDSAFYWVLGRDSLNPLAGRAVDISAQMAALELSYDRDWMRFRSSIFWASGDSDAGNSKATGFDSIMDNPQFAGGQFSFFQRQQVGILGVNSVLRNSLIPDLRSSKTQGQANFVNPGLLLVNAGIDMDLTPKLRSINNVSWLWFDKTNALERLIFQGRVDTSIGTDLSTGIEYRPFLNNQVIVTAGAATLLPGSGFRDVYNRVDKRESALFSGFTTIQLTY